MMQTCVHTFWNGMGLGESMIPFQLSRTELLVNIIYKNSKILGCKEIAQLVKHFPCKYVFNPPEQCEKASHGGAQLQCQL